MLTIILLNLEIIQKIAYQQNANAIIFFMTTSGLTEKKMSNKKFRKTETAIILAYYKFRTRPTVQKISRCAKISRSTLYRHHKFAAKIPDDYENYLLEIYSKKLSKFIRDKKRPLKIIFCQILIFILNHKPEFSILLKDNHTESIREMLDKLKNRIIKEWNYAGDADKLYKVYQNEVLGIIETWSENDFNARELENILNDILYLTKTTPKHLSRFLKTSTK